MEDSEQECDENSNPRSSPVYQDLNSVGVSLSVTAFEAQGGLISEQSNSDLISLQRNYNDHFHDPIYEETGSFIISSDNDILPSHEVRLRKGPRGGVFNPFPVRLFEMLTHVEKEGFSDVVSWQPHGRCFLIHKPKKFVNKVLPRYFKQSKLPSFTRQLNLYNFSRFTRGIDRGGYYHELFRRGRPDLCKRITRQGVKGKGTKQPCSPDTEPDFYTMESCSEGLTISSSEQKYVQSQSKPSLEKTEASPWTSNDEKNSQLLCGDMKMASLPDFPNQDNTIIRSQKQLQGESNVDNVSLPSIETISISSFESLPYPLGLLHTPIRVLNEDRRPTSAHSYEDSNASPLICRKSHELGRTSFDLLSADKLKTTMSSRDSSPSPRLYVEDESLEHISLEGLETNISKGLFSDNSLMG